MSERSGTLREGSGESCDHCCLRTANDECVMVLQLVYLFYEGKLFDTEEITG